MREQTRCEDVGSHNWLKVKGEGKVYYGCCCSVSASRLDPPSSQLIRIVFCVGLGVALEHP
jgi:hypothetical protein